MSYCNGKKNSNFIMGKSPILDIVQTTGDSTSKVMSQDAVTRELNNLHGQYSNVLVGVQSGNGAVRIDDLLPIAPNLRLTYDPMNLINQDEFFTTNSGGDYILDFSETNYAQQFFFTATIKEDADLSGISVDIYTEVFGSDLFYEQYSVISNGIISQMPITFTINPVEDFILCKIHINVRDAQTDDIHPVVKLSDVFESVSLTTVDLNSIRITSCGKNLLNYTVGDELPYNSTAKRYELYFSTPEGATITVSGKFLPASKGVTGYVYIQKSNDNWETYSDASTKVKGIWVAKNQYDVTFNIEYGYEYRISMVPNVYDNIKTYLESIQVEVGSVATTHEKYKAPIDGVIAVYPTTTLMADTDGVKMTAEYNGDINGVISKQQDEIETLKNEITTLKNEIKTLKNATLNAGGTL